MCREYQYLKERFEKTVFKNDKSVEKAINLAYADMSRRATGHTPEMKDKCLNYLQKENGNIFEKALECTNQDDFNKWHEETCEELKKQHGSFGRIGRSQKVINMVFKYLACIDEKYSNILQFCHMTLDGYTLNWYKMINPTWKKKEWSKIDDYREYIEIQNKIRKYLGEDNVYSVIIGERRSKEIKLPKAPFQAEFIIWEGEIINVKYNELIKALNNYISRDKEKDKWLIENEFHNYLNDLF